MQFKPVFQEREQVVDDVLFVQFVILDKVVFRALSKWRRNRVTIRHRDNTGSKFFRSQQIVRDQVSSTNFGPCGFIIAKAMHQDD